MAQSRQKKENLVWELDMVESKLGNAKPRLVRTKLALERMARKGKVAVHRDDEQLGIRAVELKRKLVEQKRYFCVKELARVVKKCKPMELQRVVRKLKDAKTRKEEDKIKKLELEFTVLKSLDPVAVAETYLYKRLRNNRYLYASHLVPDRPSVQTDEENVSVRADVVARLFKIKSVQAKAAECVESIVAAAELANNEKKRKRPERNDEREAGVTKYRDGQDAEEDAGDNVEDKGDADDGEEDAGDDEEDVDDDEDMAQYDGLLASDNSDDDADIDDEASIDETQVKRARPDSKQLILPSLNVGYISPSDSEPDSELNEGRHPAVALPRKNRRGQRARQKIWEQKYGAKASHVKKAEVERQAKEERKRARMSARGSNATPLGRVEDKPVEVEKLHPSWQARQQTNKPVDFKGKKIVFN
ncbi:Bud-site selection protein [Lipomyces arxii]|uniref:Bud-site selection protein n=1 Tax=Lipomyces arxii TaxID=56418 RepID=UPI0034CD2496